VLSDNESRHDDVLIDEADCGKLGGQRRASTGNQNKANGSQFGIPRKIETLQTTSITDRIQKLVETLKEHVMSK